ncbi:MAG: tRNA (guanine(10)-N(2))-dimethyltransferase [Candidatus Methanomethylicota archaeon]|uniref:tRNA (guanine(26)-N(2))-dimethyltransferase n=1 Tax=Thermoproteota archaeon TaxID=2056631 RepID=A0A497ENX5_9CREN|nr:MAG: tRNA (guanine(10)-N(2))-dimethyltransferase [Candidatus Verstraetearchaeota archaeon]RLE52882.1 MAG: tRNA (guanine(10)-N(2))-dimethyltransferase [Candidatus Verstraetearchaeota archaeon]
MIDFPTIKVVEGSVEVVVPDPAHYMHGSIYEPSLAPVFYNPKMDFNRDVAVVIIQTYQTFLGRELVICEPLTGCGIRAIRFVKEVNGVKEVIASDIDEKAIALANLNAELNNVKGKLKILHEEANKLLCEHSAPGRRFDVIDVDPFGSPMPFIDTALRALKHGGLLCATATDVAPLCGVHVEACRRKYGAQPLRSEYCHEVATRILLAAIAKQAAILEMGVKPILSYSTDHYVRVYLVVEKGARKADQSLENLGYILHCFNCLNRKVLKKFLVEERDLKCDNCSSTMHVAGPLWCGTLHDMEFLRKALDLALEKTLSKANRVFKLISLAIEEACAPPTYYVLDEHCRKLKRSVPKRESVIAKLREFGFEAYPTLFNTKGVKTNASVVDVEKAIKLS